MSVVQKKITSDCLSAQKIYIFSFYRNNRTPTIIMKGYRGWTYFFLLRYSVIPHTSSFIHFLLTLCYLGFRVLKLQKKSLIWFFPKGFLCMFFIIIFYSFQGDIGIRYLNYKLSCFFQHFHLKFCCTKNMILFVICTFVAISEWISWIYVWLLLCDVMIKNEYNWHIKQDEKIVSMD